MTKTNATLRINVQTSTLPDWVPALGAVEDVGLNTLANVGGGSMVSSTTRSWSGMAHAPWWGDLGSFINAGGGHSNGRDNDLYRYDIATRLHTKIKDRATAYQAADGYIADETTGWMWADSSGTTVQVGEPFTAHFYSFLIALPPSALAGAPNGWLFTPGRGSMPDPAQRHTKQSHKIALGAETVWTMHGAPLLRGPAHGCSIYDPVRNRVVAFSDSQASPASVHPYIDIATQAVGSITLSNTVMPFYAVGAYHAAAACYMLARYASSSLTLKVIDAANNQVYTPTVSGTPPIETAEGGWDWAEDWNAWVYYPGNGSNNIYTLKCAGDPRTDGWTWGKQTVTGTARAVVSSQGEGIPYNRLRLCSELGTENGVVLWLPDYLVPVQAFRISPP